MDKILETCSKKGFITSQEVTVLNRIVLEEIFNCSITSSEKRESLISYKFAHCWVDEFLERRENVIS